MYASRETHRGMKYLTESTITYTRQIMHCGTLHILYLIKHTIKAKDASFNTGFVIRVTR